MKNNTVKKDIIALTVLIGTFFIALPLQATPLSNPLNLTLNDYPDIYSAFITVNYNASTDVLTAVGSAMTFDNGTGPALNINSGSFGIYANINDSGILIGGILVINGIVDPYPVPLLTGNLTAFGFDALDDPLEFLFNVTGGSMAGLFGSMGGVILSNTGFPGNSFDSDFSNDSLGISDTGTPAPIPEPATFALLLMGGIPGIFVKRKWGIGLV